MADEQDEWAEAFARLTPAEQEQALLDQQIYGKAVIYTAPAPDGRTILVPPNAIVDTRDAIWNQPFLSDKAETLE